MRPNYEKDAERNALRKKYKKILPQAENHIMSYLAREDLLVCSMTDDEMFALSDFINKEVAEIVRKVYSTLERQAMQMRPAIVIAQRRRNKIAPNDDEQGWLFPSFMPPV